MITRRTLLKAAAGSALAAPAVLASKAAAASHTVEISGFEFSPASLTIRVGDTVTFTNRDGAPHTATADNGAFDTGRLGRNASATLTFNSAGQFPYFCAFHRNMRGVLTVTA